MNLEKILLLSGDGIGPSVMSSAEEVINMTTDSVEIVHGEIGRSAYESTGQYLPHDTLDLLDECKVIFTGPTIPPENGMEPKESLKVQLDLFAKTRFFKTLAPDLGVEDMEVVLWNSNNFLNDEITEVPDLDGITLTKYVRNNAYNRMMTIALSDVEIRKLSKIACLTREDFFPVSSGMFSEAFDSLFPSEYYETRHLNVKEWMAKVIKNPKLDECIVCVDLYNQIVAGVLSGLTGYDYLSPTCFVGIDYKMYDPCKKALPSGLEIEYANPTSAIISAAQRLGEMGLKDEYDRIIDAVCDTYASNERTPDVGGTLTTAEFTERVIRRI